MSYYLDGDKDRTVREVFGPNYRFIKVYNENDGNWLLLRTIVNENHTMEECERRIQELGFKPIDYISREPIELTFMSSDTVLEDPGIGFPRITVDLEGGILFNDDESKLVFKVDYGTEALNVANLVCIKNQGELVIQRGTIVNYITTLKYNLGIYRNDNAMDKYCQDIANRIRSPNVTDNTIEEAIIAYLKCNGVIDRLHGRVRRYL